MLIMHFNFLSPFIYGTEGGVELDAFQSNSTVTSSFGLPRGLQQL